MATFACYALMIDNDHEASLHLFRTEEERDDFMWEYAFNNSGTEQKTLDDFKDVCGGDLSDAMEGTNDGYLTDDMVQELPDNDRDHANDTVDAMVQAESFISGFEDDETQEGIAGILAGLRTAIAVEQAAPALLRALKLAVEHDGRDPANCHPWIMPALAAIAAAEGRTDGR